MRVPLLPLVKVPAPSTMIAKAAPNAAACEMPRVDGEPSGFLKMFCITAPATERPTPAMIAARALVSLMSQTTLHVSSLHSPLKSAERTSEIVRLMGPMETE